MAVSFMPSMSRASFMVSSQISSTEKQAIFKAEVTKYLELYHLNSSNLKVCAIDSNWQHISFMKTQGT
jgi:hypothetical protein